MVIRGQPLTPGDLIGQYREARMLSKAQLARRVGVDPSYVSELESGKRLPGPEVATKLVEALAFRYEDRTRFYHTLGLTPLVISHYREEIERRWSRALVDAVRRSPFLRRLPHKPQYLLDWAWGRFYVGQFDMVRAVPQMETVVTRADDADDEVQAIMYHDMADAYAISARPGDPLEHHLNRAEHWSQRSGQICAGMLKQQETPRARMGIARDLIMRQELAYERGDEAACWKFHTEALAPLHQAQDHYGASKSLYFLALFRFWQGRLSEAEQLIKEAQRAALDIRIKWDIWWAFRDAFFLGYHWWHVHTRGLLLDILACSGRTQTPEFDALYVAHRQAHGTPSWTRDFPPFVPRYLWLAEGGAEYGNEADQDYQRWLGETEALGCHHLHTDILISYGDFLRWGIGDRSRAEEVYGQAQRRAAVAGYRLLEEASTRRLESEAPPFPGLATVIQ